MSAVILALLLSCLLREHPAVGQVHEALHCLAIQHSWVTDAGASNSL